MRLLYVLIGLCAIACQGELVRPSSNPQTAREFVEASARYHDPASRWPVFAGDVTVTTLKIDGDPWYSNQLYINRALDTFSRTAIVDGHVLIQTVAPDGSCAASWAHPDPSEDAQRRQGLLDEPCRYIAFRQRFYDYLIGLPMVALEGEASFRENVPLVDAFGLNCHEVEVQFGNSATEPVWSLYFEPETYRLRAAKFVSASGGGEWLHYPADVAFDGFLLKAEQRWYYLDARTPVSTDQLSYQMHNP